MNTVKSVVARYKTSFVLFGIMLVGAALRFADIGTESLWVDEIYSFRQAIKSVEQIIVNAPADVHPPVYYVLLHFWTLLFGTTEAGLRSFSAVCGLTAIPLLYLLGCEIASKRVGLYAALMLALSHFHIHYSQETRSYSYVVLVVVLCMLAFVRYLRHFEEETPSSISWKTLAFYFVATVLVLYSHFFSLFVIVAQNAFVAGFLFTRKAMFKRMWKSWLSLQVLLLLVFTPWLNVLYYQIKTVKSGFWIEPSNLFTLGETFIEYAGSISATVVIFPLCILACVRLRKRLVRFDDFDGNDSNQVQSAFVMQFWSGYYLLLLLLWLALPIMIPYLQSQLSTPIYYVKYTIPALPALLLLAAKGLDTFDTGVRWMRWLVGGIIVALCCIALRDNYNDWNSLEKEVWKESTHFLNSTAARNDAVFVHEWYCKYNCEYYNQRPDLMFQALPPERFAITPTTIERFYAPIAAGRSSIWLVLSHRSAQTPLLLARIERDFAPTLDTIFSSRYRKYMIADTFPQQTQGVYLMKTYLSNDIRIMRFERKKQ